MWPLWSVWGPIWPRPGPRWTSLPASPSVWATVGLHPHDASRLDDEWPELEALARTGHRVVAVGEAGFDLFYEHSPRPVQEVAFRRQIALAHELDVTLVIHTRDAWDDTFRVLAELGAPRRTVFHCFTGGPAEAARAIELGAYVSFSGIVSFANAHDVRAAAASVPLARVLVETDAPYLAPVPHRGKQNRPAWVADVGAALAAARGEPAAEIAAATAANAVAVFGDLGRRLTCGDPRPAASDCRVVTRLATVPSSASGTPTAGRPTPTSHLRRRADPIAEHTSRPATRGSRAQSHARRQATLPVHVTRAISLVARAREPARRDGMVPRARSARAAVDRRLAPCRLAAARRCRRAPSARSPSTSSRSRRS